MEAARTSGINPVFYRVSNFVISCALAGVLGGFYAHYYGILTPDVMHTTKTVEVLAVAYIGGRSTLWGGAVVAFPFIFAMELVRSSLSNLPGLNLLLYGLLLVVVMIYYPGGFAEFFNRLFRRSNNTLLNYIFNGTRRSVRMDPA
jgi:branched-chain amino acid transport system permease protein